jgi:hypothetical protein
MSGRRVPFDVAADTQRVPSDTGKGAVKPSTTPFAESFEPARASTASGTRSAFEAHRKRGEASNMNLQGWVVSSLLAILGVGCSKKEPSAVAASAPSAAPLASSGSLTSSRAETAEQESNPAPPSPAPAADIAPSVAVGSENEPPASFAGAKKETVDNAIGLGCEARSSAGWLEFLCRKKNGTGGHPVRATFDADAGETVQADEHGELRLLLPFRDGASKDLTIEWSDTKYSLRVRDATAKLEWTGATLALRRACAALGDASRARLSAAQKADSEARVLSSEAAKLPRFATCIQAGHGSFAIALTSIAGQNEGAERKLTAELDLVHVGENGDLRRGSLGKFEFGPAGLELPALQAYDYDGDGNDEAIVSYELRARPASAVLPEPSPIWSVSDGAVVPYAKAPKLAAGSAGTEHLEYDMRPDLGEYGPFIAWLAPGCGAKDCPARVTGPRFFWHSLPDGGFSNSDASAKAVLKRACPKKPASAMVEAGGKLNTAQTAKSLVCARAWGATSDEIEAELSAKAKLLCGEEPGCALSETFRAWAKAELPVGLD